jgi:DtxR family manganese transport transcriptional regulator
LLINRITHIEPRWSNHHLSGKVRTIARLQRAGFVNSRPYRAIFLTDSGRQLAATCKSRHETVVAFLRSLGVPERIAEMDAEGIEHHVSPDTLNAFKAVLRNTGE